MPSAICYELLVLYFQIFKDFYDFDLMIQFEVKWIFGSSSFLVRTKSMIIVVGEVSYCPNQWCSYGRLVSIIVMMVFISDFYDTLITWVDPVWSQMICWCSSIAVVIQLMVIPSSSERIFNFNIDLIVWEI